MVFKYLLETRSTKEMGNVALDASSVGFIIVSEKLETAKQKKTVHISSKL